MGEGGRSCCRPPARPAGGGQAGAEGGRPRPVAGRIYSCSMTVTALCQPPGRLQRPVRTPACSVPCFSPPWTVSPGDSKAGRSLSLPARSGSANRCHRRRHRQPHSAMGGGFVSSGGGGRAADYKGGVTWYVLFTAIVASSGGAWRGREGCNCTKSLRREHQQLFASRHTPTNSLPHLLPCRPAVRV